MHVTFTAICVHLIPRPALIQADAKNVVHRDVSIGNIILVPDEETAITGVRRGVLIDWELSSFKERLPPQRAPLVGYDCASFYSFSDHDPAGNFTLYEHRGHESKARIHTILDDLESLFTWCSLPPFCGYR